MRVKENARAIGRGAFLWLHSRIVARQRCDRNRPLFSRVGKEDRVDTLFFVGNVTDAGSTGRMGKILRHVLFSYGFHARAEPCVLDGHFVEILDGEAEIFAGGAARRKIPFRRYVDGVEEDGAGGGMVDGEGLQAEIL